MNRSIPAALLCLCLPGLSSAASPQGSPARFFPPHTYVYLQVNPFSCVEGVRGLKLAKLLEDPMIEALFHMALESIPPQSDPRRMLARYPFHEAVADRFAVGVVGFTARIGASAAAAEQMRHYPEDGPLPPDLFRGGVQFEGESLVAIEVVDAALFRTTLLQFLGDVLYRGELPEIGEETVDGTELQVLPLPGQAKGRNLYFATVGDYFLAAQSAATLIDAVQRDETRVASLSTRSDFRHFERHRGGKRAAAFLHLGLDSSIDLFGPLIPRAEREEIAFWGGFDYSGLQLGLGFHDGGICEWFHLAFAENPRGILMNLARLWPSAGFVEKATERGTAYVASVGFDLAALYSATMFVLDLCDVDTASFSKEVNASLGMDLRDDLLGALGSTMGAVAVMPRYGLIPEFSLVFEVRNRAKMEKVLARVAQMCADEGLRTRQFSVPGGGPKGTYVSLDKQIPLKPAFALTGNKLVVSTMPLTLKTVVSASRATGESIANLLPEAALSSRAPLFSYFIDPAPTARDLYADLLKILDAGDRHLPFEVSDLPGPEFVASALARFGVEFSADPYFVSMDLHSPAGLAVPLLVVGGAIFAQEQQASSAKDPSIH